VNRPKGKDVLFSANVFFHPTFLKRDTDLCAAPKKKWQALWRAKVRIKGIMKIKELKREDERGDWQHTYISMKKDEWSPSSLVTMVLLLVLLATSSRILLFCPADAKTAAMAMREGLETSSHFRLVGLLSLAPFASSSIHFAPSSSSSQHSLPSIRFVRFIFLFCVSLLQADKALAMASQPSPAIPSPPHPLPFPYRE
jgi:hypothetical protein